MSRPSSPAGRVDALGEVMARHAARRGDAVFLVSVRTGEQVTFAGLGSRVQDVRQLVDVEGARPGDRVGLVIKDPVEFAVGFLGLLSGGFWVAPLDPHWGDDAKSLARRIAELRLDLVVSDRAAPDSLDTPWIAATKGAASAAPEGHRPRARRASSGGVLLSSSGTTGRPKVMALGTAQVLQTARTIAEHHRLTPAERGFSPLPLWHINAEVVGLLATMVAGASLAIDDRFHRSDFWSVMERHGVTWINAVPAIIAHLSELREGEIVPSRVRFVRSASAPLPTAFLERFERATRVPVIETYGMTEAGSQICANPLDGPRKPGSVGVPVGVEVRVDTSASPPDAPAVGQVEIRGPTVIRAYEAAGYEDRFDARGWLRTGDLGYLDDDGYLYLVGRVDDVINRGGEKLFPREIEELVMGLPDVVGAAVVGVPDDVLGQVPVLYAQLEGVCEPLAGDEARIRVTRILDVLCRSLPRERRPVQVNVVASLPAHATGKIQRRLLDRGSTPVLFQVPVS
jgi:acyl-CoA synthetase (AMP-forming)/AMP-acid ligase II